MEERKQSGEDWFGFALRCAIIELGFILLSEKIEKKR